MKRENCGGEFVDHGGQDDACHKCGSVSGVYIQICDDCMTRFNRLDASEEGGSDQNETGETKMTTENEVTDATDQATPAAVSRVTPTGVLPCPFCGCPPNFWTHYIEENHPSDSHFTHSLSCDTCSVDMTEGFSGGNCIEKWREIVNRWNRRAKAF